MFTTKKACYNSLTRQELPDEEYEFAKEVWNIFRMNTMQEYMETYCLGDTLLLAEVFETFRNESIKNFEIEPCHFVSLPGFAYQAFLKTTKAELEYITDPKFLELLQNNLRGGHSSVLKGMRNLRRLEVQLIRLLHQKTS